MATTEWLDSKLDQLINDSINLHKQQLLFLKQVIKEFENTYNTKECYFVLGELPVVYLCYDELIEATVDRIYWNNIDDIYVESTSIDNITIDGQFTEYQLDYLEIADLFIDQLKNGRYTP